MRSRVVTVTPEMTAIEAARLFEQARIGGAPVVGKHRKLLGVLSQTDLLRSHHQPGAVPAFYREGEAITPVRPFEAPGSALVEDLMTPAVLSAQEETPVFELARFMIARRIHRVVITRGGALCGIVTTMDMLRLLTSGMGARRGPSRGRQGRKARSRPAKRAAASGR